MFCEASAAAGTNLAWDLEVYAQHGAVRHPRDYSLSEISSQAMVGPLPGRSRPESRNTRMHPGAPSSYEIYILRYRTT